MISNAKIGERLAFSEITAWVSMAEYRRVAAVGFAPVTSPPTDVTVQLRKATSSSGANAANLGAAVVGESQAVAEAQASELGETGGAPFTHVQATVTSTASPDGSYGAVLRGDGRFNP